MSWNNDFVYSSFESFAWFEYFWLIQQGFILNLHFFLSFIGYILLMNTPVCNFFSFFIFSHTLKGSFCWCAFMILHYTSSIFFLSVIMSFIYVFQFHICLDVFCEVFQETRRHFVTKRRSKYMELMGCLAILVLSPNCQRRSLLVLVLANSVIRTEVRKHQNPVTSQGSPDSKIACSDKNSSKLKWSLAVGVRTPLLASNQNHLWRLLFWQAITLSGHPIGFMPKTCF